MTYIKILLTSLFVSCSCNKQTAQDPVTSAVSQAEEPEQVFADTTPFFKKPASLEDSALPQPFQDAKIDSSSTIDTSKRIHNQLKSGKRKVAVSIVNIPSPKDTKSGCFGFSANPLTGEEAAECSMYHWESACDFFDRGEVDSAYLHCKRGLSLYENGSLFYLKAKILNRLNRYSEALQASEISLNRNDHWKVQDKVSSVKERCIALRKLYKKYPSSELLSKIENNCQE